MAKVKRIEVPCVGKTVVQPDLSYITGGNVKEYGHFAKLFSFLKY